MKRAVINMVEGMVRKSFLLYLFTLLPFNAGAQTYLEHLQQQAQGLGTVSVTQSKDIDELVNGNNVTDKNAPVTNTGTNESAADKTEKKEDTRKEPLRPDMPAARIIEGSEDDAVEVDMSKKVMRQSYKINGYRVQAYAGGNTREAKQQAQEASNKIKHAYPSEPVYVHFYSPRWVCRVGNYRTLEEANRMLTNIKKLGYKQAVVVKGKITVQY